MTLIVPIVLLQCALLLFAVCFSARSGSQRNDIIGIRMWSTMSSHHAWIAGHRAAAPWTMVVLLVSIVSLGSGIWIYRDEGALPASTVPWHTGLSVIAFLAAVVLVVRRADRAAKRTLADEHLAEEADTHNGHTPRPSLGEG